MIPAKKPKNILLAKAMIMVTAIGIMSLPGFTSLINLVSSIPIINIMDPMIALGKTENRLAMDTERNNPMVISNKPSMMLVPPVRAPK